MHLPPQIVIAPSKVNFASQRAERKFFGAMFSIFELSDRAGACLMYGTHLHPWHE